MKLLLKCLIVISVAACHVVLSAESMPTVNVLTRVSMVQSKYGRATIFSVDLDNREYWITAKHVLNGKQLPVGTFSDQSVTLQILNPGVEGEQWLTETFNVIDPGKDIDIVVLASSKPLLTNPIQSPSLEGKGVTMGGDCEFLGFPYGGGWRATFNTGSGWMPYVKRCTVSALPNGALRVWILDGINNEGFSGGPVLYGTGTQQQIIGVISGYHTEPAEVIPSDSTTSSSPTLVPLDQKPKEHVNVNSGFILAPSIQYAVDAIHSNPIGPLRTTAK